MFEKVLIANRGEIAIRVMRACSELGIDTVAIYSDADKTSLYTKYADESFPLGNPSPAKSYLNIEKIMNIAKDCGADSFWYMESKTDSITAIMDKTMDGKSVWPRRLPSVKVGQMESRLFSEKELLILRGVAKGHSNKEIAGMLQISYYTVRDYVKDMLEKTGTKSRTALAVAAVGSGLIVLDKNETNPPDGKCILKSDSWNKDEG